MNLTKAQQKALRWLSEQGGSGVIGQYGKVLAAGEVSSAAPETWLRLCAYGLVRGVGGRLIVTGSGDDALAAD